MGVPFSSTNSLMEFTLAPSGTIRPSTSTSYFCQPASPRRASSPYASPPPSPRPPRAPAHCPPAPVACVLLPAGIPSQRLLVVRLDAALADDGVVREAL